MAAERPSLDAIDRRIVALLRERARRSFRDVGEAVGLSAPAVKRRVDRLEAEGVIAGYSAVLDPERFGWPMQAIVFLYCEGTMAADEVRAAVEGHPEVVAAYTVAGEASAVLLVRASDTRHLEQLLERIREHKGVLRTQTQIVLSTLFERPVSPDAA
ncbi:MAG TPA: Lrp/AsnC family transcriptional regulator [Gaiellaceae bacterium]|nr:Lrp/AsnC family transcriptional regulator [Gaiellaceae bacterium]